MNLQAIAVIGFAFAALAYVTLAALLALRRSGTAPGRLLTLAVAVQAAWAAAVAAALAGLLTAFAVDCTEALRSFSWIAFIAVLPRVATSGKNPDGNIERGTIMTIAMAAVLALLTAGSGVFQLGPTVRFGTGTLLAVLGLVVLEQVYRSADPAGRWALKFLAIGLLAMFGFDLVMYSNALLFAALDPDWFVARGYANALVAPLIAVAAVRNRKWRLDISVSRHVVFHSAALVAVGGYLLAMSLGGYWLRYVGGEWGQIAATLLVFAALLSLLVLLLSGRARAHLRVLVAKHFYNYRYDYRERWLALTRSLSGGNGHAGENGGLRDGGESADLVERAIAGLGELVESPGGAIWLGDGDDYRYAGGRNHHGSQATIAPGDPLVAFLQRTGWVIDLREFAGEPGRYQGLQLPAELAADPQAWLIVPLALEDKLLGFVLLQRSLAAVVIDWEVRDVLKAAAAQICSYLGLRRAIEQLVEAQQFETFNRMSAFVVHDLKNLVTQLGLITRNAERHKDNPEFQADMLATVENVRERMQALLMQLRDGTKPFEKPVPIRLVPLLEQVMAAKHGMQPVPELELGGDLTQVAVIGHQQRLVRALGHLLQNALEATPTTGRVVLRAAVENGTVVIEVRDSGCGMSEDFIRNQLFRAFESTKEQGMGIGTFESREYIRELGGVLEVTSQEGVGTTFVVRLPQAGSGEAAE